MLVGYAIVGLSPPALPFMYVVAVAIVTMAVVGAMAWTVVRLRASAATDDLTGVANRQGLSLTAVPLRARADRRQEPVSVALVDLDDFKAFNDEHGHLAGDAHLQACAQILAGGIRGGDVLARFGGDEFVVLLAACTPADARGLMHRIDAPDPGWSIGVAEWKSDEDLTDALSRADANLYEAKNEDPRDPLGAVDRAETPPP